MAIHRREVMLAVAAFAVLCALTLSAAPRLDADGYAYRASIIAMTGGHFGTLSTAQAEALAAQTNRCPPSARTCQFGFGPGIEFWVRLPGGRWISEKDPGYPFLAAPFQWLGIIRLAPLFYGALGCLGLFFGARRWLGRFGGTAAVALFCSSGAALMSAWQDYWPTFTDASLIAAGTGALLWSMLADGATARRRTWAGLLGFLAIEAAVFVRYTDIVVLGCAVVTVLAARRWRAASIPPGAAWWWLGSVALFGAGVAVFDDMIYGGPLRSGYRPGEVTFSVNAVLPNLRYVPGYLIQAMPVLVLGLASLAWITWRRLAVKRADGGQAAARRDFAVGMALAASWLSVWALYAAYTWTARPGIGTWPTARFYLPATGAIALLGAWLAVRAPSLARPSGRARPAASAVSAVVVVMLVAFGGWSFRDMLNPENPAAPPHRCNIGEPHCPAVAPTTRIPPSGRSAAPKG